jgi:hypothetical protein
MSIAAWIADNIFRLGMWFVMDEIGRSAFWVINTTVILSCLTYLYFDFKSSDDS